MPNRPNIRDQNTKKSAFRCGPSARAATTRIKYPDKAETTDARPTPAAPRRVMVRCRATGALTCRLSSGGQCAELTRAGDRADGLDRRSISRDWLHAHEGHDRGILGTSCHYCPPLPSIGGCWGVKACVRNRIAHLGIKDRAERWDDHHQIVAQMHIADFTSRLPANPKKIALTRVRPTRIHRLEAGANDTCRRLNR